MILVNVDEQRDVSSYSRVKQLPTILSYKDGISDKVIVSSDEKD